MQFPSIYLQRALSLPMGLGLSLVLHIVFFFAFLVLQRPQAALPVGEELQWVEIEGSKFGDGLAVAEKLPKTSTSQKPVALPAAADEVAEVSRELVKAKKNADKNLETKNVVETALGAEGGTVSRLSGTGRMGVEGGRLASLEERYALELRQLMDKYKTYPLMARKLGLQGRVLVRFKLNRQGVVTMAEVIERASAEVLNKSAMELVYKMSGVKPFPADLSKDDWQFEIPVEYKM